MGQLYPHPTKWEEHILAILHIYGARAIFLLLYENQDTESESQEKRNWQSCNNIPHKKSKALW